MTVDVSKDMPVGNPYVRSPDRTAWCRLRALHNKIEAGLERALQSRFRFGLSEFSAICALAESPTGELRMQELTETVGLNQSSVSRLVARLEQSGLSARELCETDRRGVFTVITPAGREVFEQAVPFYEATLTALYEQLAHDPNLGPLLEQVRSSSRPASPTLTPVRR